MSRVTLIGRRAPVSAASRLSRCLLCHPQPDYTNDPDENLLPGEVNMDKLRGMYVDKQRRLHRERRVERDGSVVETTYISAR